MLLYHGVGCLTMFPKRFGDGFQMPVIRAAAAAPDADAVQFCQLHHIRRQFFGRGGEQHGGSIQLGIGERSGIGLNACKAAAHLFRLIKRLGERGVLKNEDGRITALVSKEEAQAREINTLVEEKFQGSLPAFVAAFTKRRDISDKELEEVQRMIDRIRKGE